MIDLLYLLSLIILPIAGLILLSITEISNYYRVMIWMVLFFIIHNILFFFGYSLRGDNVDYIIITLEYPFVLLLFVSLADIWKNIYTKILRNLTITIIILGILVEMVNFINMFPTDMDYVCDKETHFISNTQSYEVRRYTFGFATLINTRCTFETYRTFKYLPFERLLDRTVFWDNRELFNISGDLQFNIRSNASADTLVIKAKNTVVLKKRIDNNSNKPVWVF